jgi:pSer/pThr/pTyr-binding forkhead associated (FHA) protein
MIVRRDDGLERTVAFESDLRIGRDEENDLVLEDPERGVSRFHAEFRRGSPHWSIIDLGSRNGTLVDGSVIERLTPVPPGAVVKIGPFSLEIVQEGTSTSSATAPSMPDPGRTIFSPVTPAAAEPASPNLRPAPALSHPAPSQSVNVKRAWLFIATAFVVLIIIAVFL